MNQNNNGDALLAGGITRDCIESANVRAIEESMRVSKISKCYYNLARFKMAK
jgi:hypothetical protein